MKQAGEKVFEKILPTEQATAVSSFVL